MPCWKLAAVNRSILKHFISHQVKLCDLAYIIRPKLCYYYSLSIKWKISAMLKPTGEFPIPPYAGADPPKLKG